jgi:type I restriction enzyme S subunit
MSFPSYHVHRDTGDEWFGKVPAHWSVKKLRRCLLEHRQGYYSSESYVDDGVKLVRISDLTEFGRIAFTNCPHVGECADIEPFLLNPFDFVFARTGGAGMFGMVEQELPRSVYASYLIRFRFDNSLMSNFLRYFFLSDEFQKALKRNIHGGVNQNVHAEDIKDQAVVIPPIREQSAIAAFLDRETAKINALVGEQQRLIELLNEKRQAAMSHAVTKGLNPKAPMKNSGVEWIGEVPKHWDICAAKCLIDISTSGPRGWSEMTTDTGALFFQSQNIGRAMDIVLNDAQRVNPPRDAEAQRAQLQVNDVVVCITGARTGSIAHVQNLRETTYINQHVCLLRPIRRKVHGRYLAYSLSSYSGQQQLSVAMYGLKQGLGLDDVRNQIVALPPLAEQENIIAVLDGETTSFDKLITEAGTAIALLQERRSALISAAVTGKIDVRGLRSTEAEAA